MFDMVMGPLTKGKVWKFFCLQWFRLRLFVLNKCEGLWKGSDFSMSPVLPVTCPQPARRVLGPLIASDGATLWFTELLRSWHNLQNVRMRMGGCRLLSCWCASSYTTWSLVRKLWAFLKFYPSLHWFRKQDIVLLCLSQDGSVIRNQENKACPEKRVVNCIQCFWENRQELLDLKHESHCDISRE